MTVASIIEQFNTERPNNISDTLKVGWLLKCEKMIYDTVLMTHEDCIEVDFDDFDIDSELLVDEPYDDLYIHYLDQRVALNANDTRRYNAAATLFNNAMITYQQKYNRDHKPLKVSKKMLRHEVL